MTECLDDYAEMFSVYRQDELVSISPNTNVTVDQIGRFEDCYFKNLNDWVLPYTTYPVTAQLLDTISDVTAEHVGDPGFIADIPPTYCGNPRV